MHAFRTAASIVRTAGVFALWRGNTATVIRVVPYAAITYMTFERYQNLISKVSQEKTVYTRLLAGAAAGATATLLTYPLDLMRARMAAHWNLTPKYPGYYAAFRAIIQNEGFFALFNGYKVALLGIMPYAGLSFATFETLKAWYKRRIGVTDDKQVPIRCRIAFGGFAGLVGQSATYPLDIVRRRMQVQDPAAGPTPYTSISAAFRVIFKREGLRGLYKGLSMNWIKGPIAVSVSFNTNDYLKNHFRESKKKNLKDLNHSQRYSEIMKFSTLESLMAGGLAGLVAKSIVAPVDRIRLLYQVSPTRSFTYAKGWKTANIIYTTAGLSGLWRGNVAALFRGFSFSAITYSTFDHSELLLIRYRQRDTDWFCRFFAGATAGAVATTVTYPIDLLRARMAAHWNQAPKYPSYFQALSTIVQTEGFTALFSGLKPSLLGIIPYAGVSFSCFETLKATYKSQHQCDTVPTEMLLGAGLFAGLIGQSLTYPLSVVRRRMQVYNTGNLAVWGALKNIYWSEGIKGLYKGMSLAYVKSPLIVSLSFTANDLLRGFFAKKDPHIFDKVSSFIWTSET